MSKGREKDERKDAIIDSNYPKEQFDCDIEMIKYFQEEFVYRHKHYWNIVFKVFTMVVITSLFPFASEISGIRLIETARLYSLCFPVIAFVVACLGKFVLDDEATKIKAVNNAKYAVNKCMIKRFHYDFYNPDVGKISTDQPTTKEKVTTKEKRWLSINLTSKIFAMEFLIIFTSALVIIVNLF